MPLALLTGVGRPGQVGEAVAARLAADGFEILLVDRTEENVNTRAVDLRSGGASVHPFAADLGVESAVNDLFARIRGAHGDRLGAVVHLAGGFGVTGPVADAKLEDWEKQLTINLRTAFLVARASIPLLRNGRGSMVFFSSESALTGAKVSRVSAYAVAKTGVIVLARAISQEERDSGVRVNVLAPSAIRTAQNVSSMPDGSAFVERAEVAAAVSWLCSNDSRAVTGQVIRLGPHS